MASCRISTNARALTIPIAMNMASTRRAATYPIAPISLSRFRTGYATTAVATLEMMRKTSSIAPVAMPRAGLAPAPVMRPGLFSIWW